MAMNVVYAVTRNAYEWILPSVASLIRHNPETDIYVLAEDDSLPYTLPSGTTVINVSKQRYFPKSGVNYNNWFTYINLLKVRYPSLLPVDKILHLDADTIVCDDLRYLWETDLNGKWFSSCQEYQSKYRPFGEKYYNMGVALINLEQMRKDKIEKKMQDYLNKVKQPWADQDAWNKYAIEQNKVVPMDIRYNECFATGYSANPAIVHYCGISKWYNKQDMFRVEYLNEHKRLLKL